MIYPVAREPAGAERERGGRAGVAVLIGVAGVGRAADERTQAGFGSYLSPCFSPPISLFLKYVSHYLSGCRGVSLFTPR